MRIFSFSFLRQISEIAVVFMLAVLPACEKNESPVDDVKVKAQSEEPQRIQVQHILIGFKGSLPGKEIARSQEEAAALALKLLEQAKDKDSSFEDLVRAHTDDSVPGIYSLSNTGVAPQSGEYRRETMVGAFGNIGFQLEVGEVGLAEYDKEASPYGYHVIKRLK